jgi:hypothetical protein
MRRNVTVTAVVGIVLGLTILERLEVALSAMHRAGVVAGRFATVAAPSSLWAPEHAQQVIASWQDWNADRVAAGLTHDVVGPMPTLWSYALVDTILVTVPLTVLLLLLASSIRARVPQPPASRPTDATATLDDGRMGALRQIAELATLVAVGYGLADLVENAAVPLAALADGPELLVRGIGMVSLLKLAALVLAVLPLGLLVFLRPGLVGSRSAGRPTGAARHGGVGHCAVSCAARRSWAAGR